MGRKTTPTGPGAYRFRDFVIKSLNDDLPYNMFVRWQIAGDEIAPDNPQAIAATGFLVAGNSTTLNVAMEEEKLRNRANELDDMISTTGQALLALTVACAPLPRPQIRSDPDTRLLPPDADLQQR